MKKQMPSWLVGAIIAAVLVSVFWLLGKTTTPPEPKRPAKVAELKLSDFSGMTNDGSTFRLSDTKGKVVLLNFWATWCGPCRIEIPDLIKVQTKYKDKGLILVGLSQDDNLDIATKFAKENGLNYPILIGSPKTQQELGFEGIPTSVLLDRDGKIVWMQTGINPNGSTEALLSEQIEKVL